MLINFYTIIIDFGVKKFSCYFVDTASMYQSGNTELLLGSIFSEDQLLRSRINVASKANPFNPEKGNTLSRESILKQLSTSLTSLQTDDVDLYYLHAPDVNNSLKDSLAVIQEEYEKGKIAYCFNYCYDTNNIILIKGKFKRFGLSNFATWEVVFIYYYMKERGWIVPTVYQGNTSLSCSFLYLSVRTLQFQYSECLGMYNGITRVVETELFPALDRLGISFYCYNPLVSVSVRVNQQITF